MIVVPVIHTISFCEAKHENKNFLLFNALILINNVLYMCIC